MTSTGGAGDGTPRFSFGTAQHKLVKPQPQPVWFQLDPCHRQSSRPADRLDRFVWPTDWTGLSGRPTGHAYLWVVGVGTSAQLQVLFDLDSAGAVHRSAGG
jgi:hypothetical protein